MKEKIVIIGGLGFMGKNLYKRLVQDNYAVKIITDQITPNDDIFLTQRIREDVIEGNILDKGFIEQALTGYDVIYSLAGSSGAADSILDPYKDLDTNLKGHLNILEACRKNNPSALLIFPSSRLVYGKPEHNPVDENHPLNPESIYAIHKLTTEHYYLLYKRLHNINCIIYRISNPYGPYQRFGSNHYGILNWFIHKANHGEEIELYGDGSQQRDFIHIDDVVNLFAQSIDKMKLYGKIFNVGFGKGISIKESVEIITKYVPGAKVKFKPWPEIDKKIETGDYISDISKLRKEMGWEPVVNFDVGIRQTIKFYEKKSE